MTEPSEHSSDLPATWAKVPLGRLGTWFGGGTPSKDNSDYWNGGSIPWVSPKDMKVARILDTEDHITDQAVRNSATSLVPGGAVLMVTRSGILRHTFPVAVAGVDVTLNQDLKALVLFDGLDSEYVAAALRAFADEVLSRCSKHGTTVQSIEFSRLKDFRIPVAPLNEQERIVAKIDELFSELDAGVASLKRAKALLKKYRQAVLKAAVTGELTRHWRERHKGEISESGPDLLERILKARRAAWEAAELKKLRAKGKPPKDDRWKQKYKEPQPPDTTALPALPEGWVWASGAQLFDWSSGKFLPTDQMRCGEIAVYGGNGVAGRHDAFLTPSRTLVVGRVGAHCGNVHVTAGAAWITDNAIYATVLPVDCDLEFLAIVFAQANLRQQAQGGAQPFVNQRALNETVVPLPPSSEQDYLSDQVALEMSNLGKLESEIIRCESLISSLRQAILKAAFSGKLVPQDPNDEPASVLLEGIRAERADRLRPARGRRRVQATPLRGRQLELLE